MMNYIKGKGKELLVIDFDTASPITQGAEYKANIIRTLRRGVPVLLKETFREQDLRLLDPKYTDPHLWAGPEQSTDPKSLGRVQQGMHVRLNSYREELGSDIEWEKEFVGNTIKLLIKPVLSEKSLDAIDKAFEQQEQEEQEEQDALVWAKLTGEITDEQDIQES